MRLQREEAEARKRNSLLERDGELAANHMASSPGHTLLALLQDVHYPDLSSREAPAMQQTSNLSYWVQLSRLAIQIARYQDGIIDSYDRL